MTRRRSAPRSLACRVEEPSKQTREYRKAARATSIEALRKALVRADPQYPFGWRELPPTSLLGDGLRI